MAYALIVGAGGFIGSVLRYWLSGLAHRWVQDAFPARLAMKPLRCCMIDSTSPRSQI
jgi:fluoride ion exporter CrcB/FEX